MLRVLKPGGASRFLAWGPFEQPSSTAPSAQSCVSFEEQVSGPLARCFGLRLQGPSIRAWPHWVSNVQERHLILPRIWDGSPEQLWKYQQELASCSNPLIRAIPAAMRPRVDEAVRIGLARFQCVIRLRHQQKWCSNRRELVHWGPVGPEESFALTELGILGGLGARRALTWASSAAKMLPRGLRAS